MSYIKVIWHHEFRDEPVMLYSELDGQRFEIRKVELFSDGRAGFADASASSSNPVTQLGLGPVPENNEIVRNTQFELIEIDAREFDLVWKSARSRATQPN